MMFLLKARRMLINYRHVHLREIHRTNGLVDGTKFFITTPIFYVNAAPHVGHVYSALLADALARWQKLQGRVVMFSTGSDEHGLKVQRAAADHAMDPKLFCDQVSAKFKDVFAMANVEPTDFIRTTEERHIKAVQHLWRTLQDKGYIYKGAYEGWYCTPDEAFLSERDVQHTRSENGSTVTVSRESGHVVEWLKEENYMFSLSRFTQQLLAWLDHAILPDIYAATVRSMVQDGLKDLSISRERSRLSWGIPVPGDETQTMYVWLDALTNYLTVGGYPAVNHTWPADCHLVGKDIIKFHAIFWPAFLMAAGHDPPKRILCHGHWLVDHQKMSKSVGNVVDPVTCMQRLTPEGFRYFLLREGTPPGDNSYSDARAVTLLNNELSNTLGNLLSRITAHKLNPRQAVPPFNAQAFHCTASTHDHALCNNLRHLRAQVDVHLNAFEINYAVVAVMQQLRDTNAFVDRHKPWALVKDESQREWLDTVLHVTMDTLRVCGILLQPIIPVLTDKLLTRLNVASNHRTWDDSVRDYYSEEVPLGPDCGILFTRIKET